MWRNHSSSAYCIWLLLFTPFCGAVLSSQRKTSRNNTSSVAYAWVAVCKYLVSKEHALQDWARTPIAFFSFLIWSSSVKQLWFMQGWEQGLWKKMHSLVVCHHWLALSTNSIFRKQPSVFMERQINQAHCMQLLLINEHSRLPVKAKHSRTEASQFSSRWRFDFHCLPVTLSLA